MRRDSIFWLTSLSKPFVCAAAMALVDDGKLALDAPLETLIPAFAAQRLADGSKPRRPIFIRNLMTHTSGLGSSLPDGFQETDYDLAELAEAAAGQNLEFTPGDRWVYGNRGMDVLGRIVELASGQPFHQFVADRIFGPLGAADCFYLTRPECESRMTAAYLGVAGNATRRAGFSRLNACSASPSMGLHGTAGDLARFYQMLLNGGLFEGRRVLSREAVTLMMSNQTGDWDAGFIPGFGYGLGLGVVRIPTGIFRDYSRGSFGHGGRHQIHAWADPEKQLISIILCQHLCPEALVSQQAADLIAMSATVAATAW